MKRKRGGCLSIFLIIFIILNSLGAFGYLFGEQAKIDMRHAYPMQPNWYIGYLTVACILNVIAGIGVWKWKKWGGYLFGINLAIVILFQFSYAPFWMGCLDCFDLFLIVALIIPVWKKMD